MAESGGVSSHKSKVRQFGSILGQGAYLGCGLNPQVGLVQEASDQRFSLTSMFLSLCMPPYPLSLKSISMYSGED